MLPLFTLVLNLFLGFLSFRNVFGIFVTSNNDGGSLRIPTTLTGVAIFFGFDGFSNCWFFKWYLLHGSAFAIYSHDDDSTLLDATWSGGSSWAYFSLKDCALCASKHLSSMWFSLQLEAMRYIVGCWPFFIGTFLRNASLGEKFTIDRWIQPSQMWAQPLNRSN